MVPVPVSVLRSLGHLLGKKNEVDRLVGSLCIDDSFARAELGWNPPYSAEQGIREMAADFLRARNAKHD
jgi:UDP-glucose 4-epimerase